MTLKEILAVVCDWSLYGCDKHKIALNELHRYKNILSEIAEYKEGTPAFLRCPDGDEYLLCKTCADDNRSEGWKEFPYSDDTENYPVACQFCNCIFSR